MLISMTYVTIMTDYIIGMIAKKYEITHWQAYDMVWSNTNSLGLSYFYKPLSPLAMLIVAKRILTEER